MAKTRKTTPANLSPDVLNLLEQVLGVTLPGPYREFMQDQNGRAPQARMFRFSERGTEQTSELHGVMSVGSAQTYDDLWEVNRRLAGLVGRDYLCVAQDPLGNFILLCVRGPQYGKVFFADHEVVETMGPTGSPLPEGVALIAPDFRAFLSGLTTA